MAQSYVPELKHKDVDILQENELCNGYIPVKEYKLRYRLFEGGWSPVLTRELIMRPNAAAVLLYDPEEDKVVLIEQFRMGALDEKESPWVLDIVAGLVDEQETAEIAAFREAKEEASLSIQTLIPICRYLVSVGISNEKTNIYCGLIKIDHQAKPFHGLKEDGEDIQVHIMSVSNALHLLQEGKIMAASAVIALQWLAINHSSIRSLRETVK
jgi:ADP-ribose pyrophosphatase